MFKRLFLITVLALVAVLGGFAASPSTVSAVGESVSIDNFQTDVCTPGFFLGGIVTHVNGTDATSIQFRLVNNTRGTSDGFFSSILPSGTYDFGLAVPNATEVGDNMTLYIDLSGAGGFIVGDSLTYNCGVEALGGCQPSIPSTAVVGEITDNAAVFSDPSADAMTNIVLTIGKTFWMDGLDESGVYRKTLISCDWVWVEAAKTGPNFDKVWNGTPLPGYTAE